MNQNDISMTDISGELEGIPFLANMRVVAGFDLLLDAFEDSDLVQLLITKLKESVANRYIVVWRITKLLSQNEEPDFLHPFDTAIAAYLYALNAVDLEQASRISRLVIETPRLWWARQLAERYTRETITDVTLDATGAGQSKLAVSPVNRELVFAMVAKSEAGDNDQIVSQTRKVSSNQYKLISDQSKTANSPSENRYSGLELVRVAS